MIRYFVGFRRSLLAEHGGRSVRIRALPIGIPFTNFQTLAQSSPATISNNSVKVILGVDRLDYTKGIRITQKLVFECRLFLLRFGKYYSLMIDSIWPFQD